MSLGYRVILISFGRVFSAILCGVSLIVLLSVIFPRLLSAYAIYGLMTNIVVGFVILVYAEICQHNGERNTTGPKRIMTLIVSASLFVSVLVETWLAIMLMDSQATSSIDGVLMKVDGELTTAGWMNIAESIIAVPCVAAIIGFCYLLLLRLFRG